LKLVDHKGAKQVTDIYAFLFSDVLLISKQLGTGGEARYVVLFRIKLERTFVIDSEPGMCSFGLAWLLWKTSNPHFLVIQPL